MTDPVSLPVSLLAAAAILFYGASHLLWRQTGGHQAQYPFVRGILLALPSILIAGWACWIGESSKSVALLTSGAVIFITLLLGIVSMSAPAGGISSSALKMLAPLSVGTLIIGLSGELRLIHAWSLLAMAVLLVWAFPKTPFGSQGQSSGRGWAYTVFLYLMGVIAMSIAVSKIVELPVLPLLGPVVVPLTVLGAIGLLVTDLQRGESLGEDPAVQTICGGVLALLGIGLPLVIVLAHLTGGTGPATTQPTGTPAVIMPLQAWRIDTVLLTVLSVILLPAGLGRFRLGRLEGVLLVLTCLLFLMVTVSTARW